MTRINVINPVELTDQHLLAEYRELPRVFTQAAKAIAKGIVVGPSAYTLGKGHVTFFYSRTDYLSKRQAQIIAELTSRGFNLTYLTPHPRLIGCGVSHWEPPPEALRLNLQRLDARLRQPPREDFYTHRGIHVGVDFYTRG